MNTPSNAMPDSPMEARRSAPAEMSVPQHFCWSIRRELWENRSIYIAPLSVAAVTIFGFLIATIGRALSTRDLVLRRAILEEPSTFASLLIMASAFVVAIFYCLDALHGERRDRSMLFWKSMPVSDLTTVLSKASIPILILPLITFAITAAMQAIMLLLSTAVLAGSGLNPAALWSHSFQFWTMLLYHLVAVHGLYYAPIYGWLLLVSGWARRATFLWAGVPLLAIGIFEKITFNTSYFAAMLNARIMGGPGADALTAPGGVMVHPLTLATMGEFVTSPGLWIGFAITAAFLAGAVRLRRSQGPI